MSDGASNEAENKIVEALKDQSWDYRTIAGIARETGLDPRFIREYLENNRNLVWKSSIPNKMGEDLYTLQSRSAQSKDFWRNLSTFMGKLSS